MQYYYEQEYFSKAVSESKSIREVIFKLIGRHGTLSYDTIRKYIAKYDLDTSHFTGQLWNKGLTAADHPSIKKTSIGIGFAPEEALVDGVKLSSTTIHRLLKVIGRERICVVCGVGEEWQGKALTLQVDHEDGDPYNNKPNNLRIMCPNCHSQTPTFGARGRKTRSPDQPIEVLKTPRRPPPRTGSCKVCQEPCGRRATYCSQKCRGSELRRDSLLGSSQPRGIRLPDIDQESVLAALEECSYNISAAGRKLKLSRTSVRNFLHERSLYHLIAQRRPPK